jgi:hypothetical protein
VARRSSAGGSLSDLDLHELDRWLTELGRVRRQALMAVARGEHDSVNGAPLQDLHGRLSDFAVAGVATQLMVQASRLRVELSGESLRTYIQQEEQARSLSGITELLQAAKTLAASSDYWTEAWEHYNKRKPKSMAVRTWNRVAVVVPRLQTEAANEPKEHALALADRDRLRSLADRLNELGRPRALIALEPDGSVAVSQGFTT